MNYNSKLLDLSTSETSNVVVTFSGIQDRMFFFEIIHYCDDISKENLINKKNDDNEYIRDVYSFVTFFEESEIKDIKLGGSGHSEICIKKRN